MWQNNSLIKRVLQLQSAGVFFSNQTQTSTSTSCVLPSAKTGRTLPEIDFPSTLIAGLPFPVPLALTIFME
jgi:hypothetical protein